MKPLLINQCDEWCSFASFKFVGVFTNREQFNRMIIKLITEKKIEFEGNIPDIKDMSPNDIISHCTYIHSEEITLNYNFFMSNYS